MSLYERMKVSVAGMALFALVATAVPVSGQATADDAGVVVLNESMHELRVYAYDATENDERVLLGWVGDDELEFFDVPETAMSSSGEYRIGVQQVTPLPQIGVPATPHPMLASSVLSPNEDETVRITVSHDMTLSEVVVR